MRILIIGAGNKEELKNLLSKSIKFLGMVAIVMTRLAEILAKPLASIFVSYDKDLLELTTNAIRIYSLSYIISWFNIFASSFFTAFLFEINGIWFSVVGAELLALAVSITCIIKNRKKYEYV